MTNNSNGGGGTPPNRWRGKQPPGYSGCSKGEGATQGRTCSQLTPDDFVYATAKDFGPLWLRVELDKNGRHMALQLKSLDRRHPRQFIIDLRDEIPKIDFVWNEERVLYSARPYGPCKEPRCDGLFDDRRATTDE